MMCVRILVRLVRRALTLMYIGFRLSLYYIPLMIMYALSAALWFVFILNPVALLAKSKSQALLTFLPGLLTAIVVSCGMHESTEFLRFYVRQGIFDMFRECGLGVLHYLIANVLFDIFVIGMPSYLLSALIVLYYTGLSPTLLIPHSITMFVLGLAALVISHILFGMIVACLYTFTTLSEVWLGMLEAFVAVCSLLPVSAFPSTIAGLALPVTLVTEIMRAAYGTNTVPTNILLPALALSGACQIAATYLMHKLCERHIAKRGVPLRW